MNSNPNCQESYSIGLLIKYNEIKLNYYIGFRIIRIGMDSTRVRCMSFNSAFLTWMWKQGMMLRYLRDSFECKWCHLIS